MNGSQIIPIIYDDFYKFTTSLGLLILMASLYLLVRYANLIFIASLSIGTYLAWWGGGKWYAKQQLRDEREKLQLQKELLELEDKKHQIKPQKSSA